MDARDFYDKRVNEIPEISSVQLMEEFAKHVVEIYFCDGSPLDFEKLTIGEMAKIHKNINLCVDWVNT